MRLIYLACPGPEGRDDLDCRRLVIIRERWCKLLVQRGMTVYNPLDAWCGVLGGDGDDRIYRIDHRAVTLSDGLLFHSGRSTGSGMEIEKACNLGIPVVAFVNQVVDYTPMLNRPGVHVLRDEAGAIEAIDMLSQKYCEFRQSWGHKQRIMIAGGGELPTQAYGSDTGFDLYANEDVTIPVGATMSVPFGISVQMPDGYWAWIVARSSTIRKRRLLVTQSIIDSGYRGSLFADATNIGESAARVKKGERIAQLIPMGHHSSIMRPVKVQSLDPSDRGNNGFGSSGA